jgi:hypothetical protein
MSGGSLRDKKYVQWIESIEDCLAICNTRDGCKLHKGPVGEESKKKLPDFILVDSGKLINASFVQSLEENKKTECISIFAKSFNPSNAYTAESVCKKHNVELYNILQTHFGSK